MKRHRRRHSLILAIAMLAVVPGSALATPEQEHQLVAAANTQLDVLYNPSAEKSAQIKALYALKDIRARMKVLADADPHFKQRSDTEEFRNMYEGMGGFIKDEAKKLGVDLSKPPAAPSAAHAASAPSAPNAVGACTASPTPQYYDRDAYAPLGQDVRDAYAKLSKQLDQPPADTFQGRVEQTAKRDALLQKYILAQIAYVWQAAGHPPTAQWVGLLNAKDRFSKALQDKRGADAEEQKLMARLAALQAQWDNLKRQFVKGGKVLAGYMQLEADAQKTIKRIMEIRKRSNASYGAFLASVGPMEKKAAALFKSQMKKGTQEINYHLSTEGNKGQPFTLFRPKTKHERDLLNRLIGRWIIHKLGVLGAREGVPWVDWSDFKDFDFDTKGLAPGSNCQPKTADRRQLSVPPKKDAPKKKKVCHGGGLVGRMNCVTTMMGN